MKAQRIAGAVFAALIVVVAAALLFGIPSSLLTSAIEARLQRETGYRIAVAGAARLGVWPELRVMLHDVTFSNPNDSIVSGGLTVERIEASLPWQGVLSGHLHVNEMEMFQPVLRVPLLRERIPQPDSAARQPTPSGDPGAKLVPAGHIAIHDGAVVFSNPRDHVESRIDGINADARAGTDQRIDVAGSARLGAHPFKFSIKSTAPSVPGERQTVPVELSLDSPGLLRQPLSAKAEVHLRGSVLMINGLSGVLEDGQFNGWASADLGSKPLVKLDLDFQRLGLGASSRQPAGSTAAPTADQPWSSEKIELGGLNYVDAQVRISAAELVVGAARIAPAAIEATLAGGKLKAVFSHLGIYEGEAEGELGLDLTNNSPAYALRCDLNGVRALPLLSGLADFDKLDGKMQAKLSVRAAGDSPRAIISSLGGTASVKFQDGAILGLNVARMIRALTLGTLSGWQEAKDQTTDLSQLGASFRIEGGQATTGDLVLIGPLVRMSGTGNVDLEAKSLAFRVEPKLVMTLQGQGGAADPVGLGIPVLVQGPWNAPNIYPEIAGILSDPDAAYAKLREMGKGLFGTGGESDPRGGKLGETLGTLIQQGLDAARRSSSASPGNKTAPDQLPPMNDILKQLFGR